MCFPMTQPVSGGCLSIRRFVAWLASFRLTSFRCLRFWRCWTGHWEPHCLRDTGSFSVLGTKVFKSPLMGMGDEALAMIGGFWGGRCVFTTLFDRLRIVFRLVRRYVFRSSDLSVAFICFCRWAPLFGFCSAGLWSFFTGILAQCNFFLLLGKRLKSLLKWLENWLFSSNLFNISF